LINSVVQLLSTFRQVHPGKVDQGPSVTALEAAR
jgi:hypothetical protein